MTRSTGTSGLIFWGVAAESDHGVAHCGEIHHGGHAGEVLHQHARGAEGDLGLDLAEVAEPRDGGGDVVLLHRAVVLEPQQVLEDDLHREGQSRRIGEAGLLGMGDRVVGIGFVADGEGLAGVKAVE